MAAFVTTPHGQIAAAWGYYDSAKLMMELTAPKGTEGRVVPPVAGQFTVNGRKAQAGDSITVYGGQGKVLIGQV
ncbi:hypothetical protein ACM66B_004792 [Microbotryomycetes sp. NB124-2]